MSSLYILGGDSSEENVKAKYYYIIGSGSILNPGEGAFYGPKLEFVLRDAIGRDWQCGTWVYVCDYFDCAFFWGKLFQLVPTAWINVARLGTNGFVFSGGGLFLAFGAACDGYGDWWFCWVDVVDKEFVFG